MKYDNAGDIYLTKRYGEYVDIDKIKPTPILLYYTIIFPGLICGDIGFSENFKISYFLLGIA